MCTMVYKGWRNEGEGRIRMESIEGEYFEVLFAE